jgi:hypothetical protein
MIIKMETVATKKKLETALKKALKQALIEMESVGSKSFSEESLRYLVMSEISKTEFWGTFPNQLNSENKLLFEQEYYRDKRDKDRKETFKPDIVSINKHEHLLAIELKITNDIKDVDKCKEYIDPKKGSACFKLAAAVYAIHKDLYQVAKYVEPKIKSAIKRRISRENGRLLVAYIEWPDDNRKNGLKINVKNKICLEWIY